MRGLDKPLFFRVVPTKTSTEWNAFTAASKPAFIVATQCYPKSCKEIKDTLGSPADGVYTIDSDGVGGNAQYQVSCDMTTDGGGWTRIMYHDYSVAGVFASDAEALNVNSGTPLAKKYSILNRLAGFYRGGKLELGINWAGTSTKRNWWTQTSNFTTSPVAGYTAVAIESTSNFWGGLEYNGGADTLADGSVNHINWFYSVGAKTVNWGATPPGLPASEDVAGVGVGVPRVELWVK